MTTCARRGMAALVAAAWVSGCSPAGPRATPPPTPTAAPSSATAVPTEAVPSPAAVPRELRFTAPALRGGTVEGADHAGGDLVMWFWAPW